MMGPVETAPDGVCGIIEDPGLNRLGIPQGPRRARDSAGLVVGSGYKVYISCL